MKEEKYRMEEKTDERQNEGNKDTETRNEEKQNEGEDNMRERKIGEQRKE